MPFSALSVILPVSYVVVQVVTAGRLKGQWRSLALLPLMAVCLTALGGLISRSQGGSPNAMTLEFVMPTAIFYLMLLTMFRAALRGG